MVNFIEIASPLRTSNAFIREKKKKQHTKKVTKEIFRSNKHVSVGRNSQILYTVYDERYYISWHEKPWRVNALNLSFNECYRIEYDVNY